MKKLLVILFCVAPSLALADGWRLFTVNPDSGGSRIVDGLTQDQCVAGLAKFLGAAPHGATCPSEDSATKEDWMAWQAAHQGVDSCVVVNGGMAWTAGQDVAPGQTKYAKCIDSPVPKDKHFRPK